MQLIFRKELSRRKVWPDVSLWVGAFTIVAAISLGAEGGDSPPGSPPDASVDADAEQLILEEYGGGSIVNPDGLVIHLLDSLGEMEDALAGELGDAGFTAMLQPGVPVIEDGSQPSSADGELLVMDDVGVIGTGSYSVVIHRPSGTADLFIELTEGSATRTLALGLGEAGDTLTVWGTITVDAGQPLSGGWTYSAADGAQEDPDSDPDFHDEVRTMLHVGEQRGIIAAALQFIGSVVGTSIGYILDTTRSYNPPTTCDGAYFYDAPGQSCDGVNIPCKGDIGSLAAQWIDALPGVSTAFKKCMKGRAGCGGSYHNRVGFSCADPANCGPCGLWGGLYGGCSLGGSQGWYCHDTTNPCECAMVVFHEMSHSCFALDLKNGSTYDAYGIGYWFRDRCVGIPTD